MNVLEIPEIILHIYSFLKEERLFFSQVCKQYRNLIYSYFPPPTPKNILKRIKDIDIPYFLNITNFNHFLFIKEVIKTNNVYLYRIFLHYITNSFIDNFDTDIIYKVHRFSNIYNILDQKKITKDVLYKRLIYIGSDIPSYEGRMRLTEEGTKHFCLYYAYKYKNKLVEDKCKNLLLNHNETIHFLDGFFTEKQHRDDYCLLGRIISKKEPIDKLKEIKISKLKDCSIIYKCLRKADCEIIDELINCKLISEDIFNENYIIKNFRTDKLKYINFKFLFDIEYQINEESLLNFEDFYNQCIIKYKDNINIIMKLIPPALALGKEEIIMKILQNDKIKKRFMYSKCFDYYSKHLTLLYTQYYK